MTINVKVLVQHCCPETGRPLSCETFKDATVKLQYREYLKFIIVKKDVQVSLTLRPPLRVITSQIAKGCLTVCLYATKKPLAPANAQAVVVQQLCITGSPPDFLQLLVDEVQRAIRPASHNGRAKQQQNPAKHITSSFPGQPAKRLCERPATSWQTSSRNDNQHSSSCTAPAQTYRVRPTACGVSGCCSSIVNPRFLPAQTVSGSTTAMHSIQDVGEVCSDIAGSSSSSLKEQLPSLTAEQRMVLDAVRSGRNVFFTGCAGTGKSLVLKHIIAALPLDTTFVTAPTGLAASALGGTTLQAFAGVGRGEGSFEVLLRAASRYESLQRWLRCTTLVIDEVSMIDGRFFDALEGIARSLRRSSEPFGGIQLVLCGDFHQLPPVSKGAVGLASRRFLFEAASWDRCVHEMKLLTQVFRQQGNKDFVKLLNHVRNGSCTAAMMTYMQARCSRELDISDGIVPVKLFTHRADVETLNDRELAGLKGEVVTFQAIDTGSADVLNAGCPARSTLHLKQGAQVMLLTNISTRKGLVNGAKGRVIKFAGNSKSPVVKFACGSTITVSKERWQVKVGGQVMASRLQLPLELAWAMSVHKSQGMTLEKAELSLEAAFEPGMVYVALSRVKSLDGLRIVGNINMASMQADAKVLAFYRRVTAQ